MSTKKNNLIQAKTKRKEKKKTKRNKILAHTTLDNIGSRSPYCMG
jgi:hypothetical protein